ncbi:MAG TPA: LysM peptidoglycan-binding domain-containing protein [Chloroflexota bacterium]
MLLRSLLFALLFAIPFPVQAAGYMVRPGDTLGSIAKRHGVAVRTLARLNGISNVNLIRIGQYLTVPIRRHSTYYHVVWGDTLSGISARYGVGIATIRAMNPRLGAYPLAGEWLKVCTNCSSGGSQVESAQSAGTTSSGTTGGAIHVVQAGETLSGIASQYGVTTTVLATANRLLNADLVVIGSQLRIPGSVGYSSTGYDPWTARALIVEYAHIYGLDPALPLAIGWQESGFNENMISPTGAIGVMQVEPYTGTHISALLGRRMNLYDIRDNIQSGVFWISTLVQYYGGNERLAIAAYYQGSRSLARRGFYQDTVQYVANVTALRARFSTG